MEDAHAAQQPPERWIAAYGDALMRFCYLRLGDRQLAQDALQETLFRAWKAYRRKPDVIDYERAWLYKIAGNACRDMKRGAWFQHVDRQTPIDALSLADGATPEDRLLFLDVLRLPEKLRQAILLYYYENMTLSEIARALGTSTAAIHRRLQKAKELLKVGEGDAYAK